MREFKFRAWHEGYEYKIPPSMIYDSYPGECFYMLRGGQPVTIMQNVGLKDKNGVDIYELDIVEVLNKGMYNGLRVVCWDETTLSYVLIWPEDYEGFKGTGDSGKTFLKVSIGISCIVRGNTHQHPELLNTEK